jgi:hypothetical protein
MRKKEKMEKKVTMKKMMIMEKKLKVMPISERLMSIEFHLNSLITIVRLLKN